MAYDFCQKRIGAAGSRERNGGVYTKTILGQSLGEAPVPTWTADKSKSPFVAFQDPETQKIFGINKDMLAYGLLAVGAPGTGKTNFFNMILNRMLTTMQPTDVMLLLPRLEHLADSLNFGRSLGVKVMCGLQNTCGLEEQYGEAGAKNILSSFQNMAAFRTNDYDTRQFVINRLGENYQNFSFSAQQTNLNIQRAGHMVEDWNILKLKNGEAVVSLTGEDPFLFTMPLYR